MSVTKRALADACEAVRHLQEVSLPAGNIATSNGFAPTALTILTICFQRMSHCTRIICSDPSSMPLKSQLLLMVRFVTATCFANVCS